MLTVTDSLKLHPTHRPVAATATGANRADDYGSSTRKGPAIVAGRLLEA